MIEIPTTIVVMSAVVWVALAIAAAAGFQVYMRRTGKTPIAMLVFIWITSFIFAPAAIVATVAMFCLEKAT